ncbi:MAG: hypothetical protein U1F25_01295 [Rubrivivax sp.]
MRRAVGRFLDDGVVRRDVRVFEHEVVVDRAADGHRPRGHRQCVAHAAVAVEHLDAR